jgi:hypothetical protein
MDVGPPKARSRVTKAVSKFQVEIVMTAAQVVTFETFYKTTLSNGALSFTWVHPRTQEAMTTLFTSTYRITPFGAEFVVGFSMQEIP